MAAVGVVGGVSTLSIPIIFEHFGLGGAPEATRAMGWWAIGLIPVAVLIALSRTPERPNPNADLHNAPFPAARLLGPGVAADPVRGVILAYLCSPAPAG